MARREQPKENLIEQATALIQRVELRIAEEVVTIGFRKDGAASLFFNDEPVYHFNAANELRRAYDDGMIKAVDGALVKMKRERTKQAVQLISKPLPDEEQAAFLGELASRCEGVLAAIKNGRCNATRQVPKELDLLTRVAEWLGTLEHPVDVAGKPNA